jgi:hypothetical protein
MRVKHASEEAWRRHFIRAADAGPLLAGRKQGESRAAGPVTSQNYQ